MNEQVSRKKGKRLPGGGRKKGSGKYLEETRICRVPVSVANNIDFFYNLPEMLEDFCILWDTRYSGSVRSEVASKCASDLRELMALVKRSTL